MASPPPHWTPHQRTWVMDQRDAQLLRRNKGTWATITTAYNLVFPGAKRTKGGMRLELHKISRDWYHSNGVLGEMRAWCVLHKTLDFPVFTTPGMVRVLPAVHRGTERERALWVRAGRSVLGPAVVGGVAPVAATVAGGTSLVGAVVGGAAVVQMPTAVPSVAPPVAPPVPAAAVVQILAAPPVALPVALPVAPPAAAPSVPSAPAVPMRDGSSESSRTLVGDDNRKDKIMVDAPEQQGALQTAERKDSRGCPPPVFDDATMDAAFTLLGMSRGCMLEEAERKMLLRGLGVS